MLSNRPLMSNSRTQSYFQHRLRVTPTASSADLFRPVAVGVRQEYGIEIRLNQLFDHHLRDPVAYGGHTQNPFAPTLLRNGDSADRRRKVGSRAHPIPDLIKVSLQVGLECLDRLTIHAGRTLLGFDRFIGFVHSPLLDQEKACSSYLSSSSCSQLLRSLRPPDSAPSLQPHYGAFLVIIDRTASTDIYTPSLRRHPRSVLL